MTDEHDPTNGVKEGIGFIWDKFIQPALKKVRALLPTNLEKEAPATAKIIITLRKALQWPNGKGIGPLNDLGSLITIVGLALTALGIAIRALYWLLIYLSHDLDDILQPAP